MVTLPAGTEVIVKCWPVLWDSVAAHHQLEGKEPVVHETLGLTSEESVNQGSAHWSDPQLK